MCRLVVRTEIEADAAIAEHGVAGINRPAPTIDLLKGNRAMLDDIALAGGDQQIAQGVELERPGTVDGQCNLARVSTGRDQQVVLELALVAVVHQVDARVDVGVLDAREVGHARAPLAGVIADQVVARVRLFVQGLQRGILVCAIEREANHCAVARFRFAVTSQATDAARRVLACASGLQADHCFGRGQEQVEACIAREKANLRVALASIGFEADR